MASAEFQEEIGIDLQAGRLREQDLAAVQNAVDIVHQHAQVVGSVLAHTDFRAGNVLYMAATEPPYVVIDPNSRITHPYMCLAYTIVLETIHAKNDPAHLLAGYSQVAEIEPKVLTAANLLVIVSLLSRWGHETHPYAGNLLRLFAEMKGKLTR
jgi:Ser/Thr protein kinase RdoA (MazF antagonist)